MILYNDAGSKIQQENVYCFLLVYIKLYEVPVSVMTANSATGQFGHLLFIAPVKQTKGHQSSKKRINNKGQATLRTTQLHIVHCLIYEFGVGLVFCYVESHRCIRLNINALDHGHSQFYPTTKFI